MSRGQRPPPFGWRAHREPATATRWSDLDQLGQPVAGPDLPGVHVEPDELDPLDLQALREDGHRVCRRCGWAVPLMTADDGLCVCGGQLL